MGSILGSSRLCVAAVCVALLAAACDGSNPTSTPDGSGQAGGGTDADGAGGVFRVPIAEPRAIDPYNARESEGINVTKQLFVGLVTYDGNADLAMRPGVAERWAPSEDCTRWTFNLSRTRFSNGEDVDAQSFIRGWTRAAIGTAASQASDHMAGIEGYDDLHATPPRTTTFSGLSAPDPWTLDVRLAEADCYFDKKTLVPVMSPVPSVAGAADNQAYNEAPVGNGPFKLAPGTKWEHNEGISLVRNDSYFGPRPSLDGVEFTIFPAPGGLDAQYRAFTAGEVDFARIPLPLLQQAQDVYGPDGGILKTQTFGINYIMTNTSRAPLNNADARKAVSMAIDREAVNAGVYQGSQTPAAALVPPPAGEFHQPDVCGDACRYDPGAARQLAGRSGLPAGTRIKLAYNVEGGNEPLAQAWKDQLERNLGVVVDLDGAPFPEHLQKRNAGDFDLALASWGADYPSADSFLYPLLFTGAESNDARYSNPAFDALVLRARGQRSDTDRQGTIKEAERLAIGRDLPLIPTLYRIQYRVFDAAKWDGVGLDFFENPTLEAISLKA